MAPAFLRRLQGRTIGVWREIASAMPRSKGAAWDWLSLMLMMPLVLPVALIGKIAARDAPNTPPAAVTPEASLFGNISRLEYLFFLVAILLQENVLLNVPRELMGETDTSGSDSLSVSLALITLIGTGWLCWRHRAAVASGISRNLLILLLPVLDILSTGWSMDPGVTLKRSILAAGASMFWLYAAVRLTLPQVFAILSRVVMIGAWGSLFFTLAFPNLGREVGDALSGDWRGIFSQKNVLGNALSTGIFVLIFDMLLQRRALLSRVVTAALCAVLIRLSDSSTALASSLVVVLGCASFLLLRRGADGRLLVGGLALFGLVALVATTFIDPTAPIALLGRDRTLSGRTDLWHYVIELINERPILGWGYKAMWSPEQTESTYIWNQIQWAAPQAHDGYLEIGLSLGTVGWIALGVTFFAWGRRVFACLSQGENLLAAMLCTIVVQQLFVNITESLMNDTTAMGWNVTVFLAMYAGFHVRPAARRNALPSPGAGNGFRSLQT